MRDSGKGRAFVARCITERLVRTPFHAKSTAPPNRAARSGGVEAAGKALGEDDADFFTDVRELVRGLSEEQLRWRPDDRRWSVLECIAHLIEAAKQYAPAIGSALDRARANGWFGNGPFRYGMFSRWFARSMEPPAKIKVKTTPFPPVLSAVTHDVLSDFDRQSDCADQERRGH